MTSPDTLVRHTCRNCGADLKHITSGGDNTRMAAHLRCTECDAPHLLTITLRTFKGVAA